MQRIFVLRGGLGRDRFARLQFQQQVRFVRHHPPQQTRRAVGIQAGMTGREPVTSKRGSQGDRLPRHPDKTELALGIDRGLLRIREPIAPQHDPQVFSRGFAVGQLHASRDDITGLHLKIPQVARSSVAARLHHPSRERAALPQRFHGRVEAEILERRQVGEKEPALLVGLGRQFVRARFPAIYLGQRDLDSDDRFARLEHASFQGAGGHGGGGLRRGSRVARRFLVCGRGFCRSQPGPTGQAEQ